MQLLQDRGDIEAIHKEGRTAFATRVLEEME